ncbi:MAG: DUF658 family protein [Carnobacterium sp.]|uniref:DUF658 family protein n=1 Tax=Lactobacillales TaxID=186826 RepID=UPI002FC79C8F
MARLEKIYDVYFNGIKTVTGTKKEISKMLCISPHSVAALVKNGMANSPKKNAVKIAIVNEKAMMEKYPGWKPYGGSKSKISDEITDRDRRKNETKEERRLRRNIRAQMAIENSRKDDSVFK